MSLIPRKKSEKAFNNFLLAHYERALRRKRVTSRPFMLLLDPSSLCQLQCPVCPTGLENAGEVGHGRAFYRSGRTLLRRDLFTRIIDELGDYLFFVQLYNWGEPLLNPELNHFIAELGRRDIAVAIHSNLSLPLSDEALTGLIENGTDRIEASIDGFSQESYARYRRKGRFQLARDNLVRLAEIRDRLGAETRIVWNFLLFRFNEHEADTADAFCRERGIEFVRREAAIFEHQREEFLPSHRRGEPTDDFFALQARPFEPQTISSRPEQSCGWHYFYSAINADGSLSPCCAPWESDWDFGRITTTGNGFADIWNGPEFQASRRDVSGRLLLEELRSSGELTGINTIQDLLKQGTICQGCQLPPGVRELYSHLADAVVTFYRQHTAERNTLLNRAFERLRPQAVGTTFLNRAFELVRSQPQEFVRHYRRVAEDD